MDDPLVTIASFGSALNANLAKARLEAAGIRAFLVNEVASALSPMGSEVGLQVAESDEHEAIAILSGTEPFPDPERALAANWRTPEEPERCPVCEASLVQRNEPALPLRLVRFLFSVFLPLPDSILSSRRRTCGVCGYHWREGDPGVTRVPSIES